MYDGIVVLFEVGLAILHMLRSELILFNCQVELTQHVRKRTLDLNDPKLLLKHVCEIGEMKCEEGEREFARSCLRALVAKVR